MTRELIAAKTKFFLVVRGYLKYWREVSIPLYIEMYLVSYVDICKNHENTNVLMGAMRLLASSSQRISLLSHSQDCHEWKTKCLLAYSCSVVGIAESASGSRMEEEEEAV